MDDFKMSRVGVCESLYLRSEREHKKYSRRTALKQEEIKGLVQRVCLPSVHCVNRNQQLIK